MNQTNKAAKDFNFPNSAYQHQRDILNQGAQSFREQSFHLNTKDQYHKSPSMQQDLQDISQGGGRQVHNQKLMKMNSCYFQENNIERMNKPHLISSASTNIQLGQQKSYCRIAHQQPNIYSRHSLYQGKENNSIQQNIDGNMYYLQPAASANSIESKENFQRFNDFSTNSQIQYYPSTNQSGNSSQMNNSQFKQNNYNDINGAESVKLKQYQLSQQSGQGNYNDHSPALLSSRETNFSSIKRNILGEILNLQNQNNEITSKKITLSITTTPKSTTPKNITPKNSNQAISSQINNAPPNTSIHTTPINNSQKHGVKMNSNQINANSINTNRVSNSFKSDQFNESLNRINKLKDKYSYIDKRESDIPILQTSQIGAGECSQHKPQFISVQNDGIHANHLVKKASSSINLNTPLNRLSNSSHSIINHSCSVCNNQTNIVDSQQSMMINQGLIDHNLYTSTNYSNQRNISQYQGNNSYYQGNTCQCSCNLYNFNQEKRVSFIESEINFNKTDNQEIQNKINPENQFLVNQRQERFLSQKDRSQSSFFYEQQQQKPNSYNSDYQTEVQNYKQYFIENDIESDKLNKEQESLKDENEKLRLRLKELLRISQIQTGNLQEKLEAQSKQSLLQQANSQNTTPRDQSKERKNQTTRQKTQSQYLESDNINMRKDLEECVLLLESSRQKIDSLKFSINEKDSLIKKSGEYTQQLEEKISSIEKENGELKCTIDGLKRSKSQNLNLIEQISINGYQENLREQIIKQFNHKFVDFLESQKKLIKDLKSDNIHSLEDVGHIIFKLSDTVENGKLKQNNQDLNAYRVQLLRHVKEEINKLKFLMIKKLNIKEDKKISENNKFFDNFLLDKVNPIHTSSTPTLQQNNKSSSFLNKENREQDYRNNAQKNIDSFQLYLAKNTDSLNVSLASIKTSEIKNKQTDIGNSNNKNNQKNTSFCEDDEFLQMLLLQAQSIDNIFKNQYQI